MEQPDAPASAAGVDTDDVAGTDTDDAVRLEADVFEVVSYAMANNDVSLVRSVTLTGAATRLPAARLSISLQDSEGTLTLPMEVVVDIEEGQTTRVSDPKLLPDPAAMSQVHEQRPGQIRLQLSHDGKPVASASYPVRILAANQWLNVPKGLALEMLSAHVMPNAPEISDLLPEVGQRLQQTTGRSSIDGYQSDAARVDSIVEAVYHTIQRRDITYAEPPASWSDHGQKVRTPREVLVEPGVATCLDTTVVMAAALEQTGVRPLLWLLEGHIVLGYWREEVADLPAATQDVSTLINLLDLGLLQVVETTALTGDINFDAATAAARARIRADLGLGVTDVFAARRAQIIPLPALRRVESGAVEVVEYRPADHSVAPAERQTAQHGPAAGHLSEPVPLRVQRWKNALLDLSLRNRLINFTDRAGLALILPGHSLGVVEDALHSGRNIRLLPSDDVDSIQAARSGQAHAGLVDPSILHEQLQRTWSVHLDVATEAYRGQLLALSHRARTIQEETGANNLFLALGTLVWEMDDRELRSPIILTPVELTTTRGSRRSYRMSLDETGGSTPNFSLLEKLWQQFGLRIPDLANPAADASGVDLDAAFRALRVALANAGLPFRVEETAHLAILMFGKFRLWKDIDDHWQQLAQQPLVTHLIHTPTQEFADPAGPVSARDLDALAAACPIPADASQLTAIAAALDGRSLVLEGPPGTGKSQTIANLLARCIADGKRVLFVAEKRAALEVVQERISQVGLRAFALDLHDKGSRPVAVRRQILESLDLSVGFDEQGLVSAWGTVEAATRALTRYRDAVHTANAADLSLYGAQTQLLTLGAGPVLAVTEEFVATQNLDTTRAIREALRRLPDVAYPAYPSPEAPWLFAGNRPADEVDLTAVSEARQRVAAALEQVDGAVGRAVEAAPTMAALGALSAYLRESVQARSQLVGVGDTQWRARTAEVMEALSQLQQRAARMGAAPALMKLPAEQLIAQAQAAAESGFWGRRARLRQAAAALADGLAFEPPRQRNELRELAGRLRDLLDEANAVLSRIWSLPAVHPPAGFNVLDPAELPRLQQRIRDLELMHRELFTTDFVHLARELEHQAPGQAADLVETIRSGMRCVFDQTGATDHSVLRWQRSLTPVAAWRASGHQRAGHGSEFPALRRWLEFRAGLEPLETGGLEEAHWQLLSGEVAADYAAEAFERGLAGASLGERRATGGLSHFDGAHHNHFVNRFASSSQEVRALLPSALAAEALSRRSFSSVSTAGRVGELRRALSRQRGGLTVREMMERYGEIISSVMPCFLVSPDSLARFIPATAEAFDLVVFDEASQIRVCDAVGAIGRAKSVVVVGDSKQMPPTSFAESSAQLEGDDELGDTLGSAVEDEESILGECVQAGVERHWLSWHYRSQDESLIAFSNARYYDGRLSSFPAPLPRDRAADQDGYGIHFRRVDGHFERSASGRTRRTNRVEAEEIVAEIQRRFGLCPAGSEPSIGVVTFNQPQRALVELLLRETEDERIISSLESSSGLFVKNLENVQGDERDVILFSVAFSRNRRGVLPLNFGPLNLMGGERRLNVAITRARRQVVLFCSFDPSDLRAEETTSAGIGHLKGYLELAQRGPDSLLRTDARSMVIDRHREEIAERLRARGLVVTTDVGLSDFRVDLVVFSPEDPEQPVVAVLLDGLAWASRRTVGDRDGTPVLVLSEMMRWPAVHRVWLPTWLIQPEVVLDELEALASTPVVAAPPPEPQPVVDRAEEPVAVEPAAEGAESHSGDTVVDQAELFDPWEPADLLPRNRLDSLQNRAARNHVSGLIAEIVAHEGPIHTGRLARLVANAHGLTRVVQSRVAQILVLASAPDADGFLWPGAISPESWLGYRTDPHQRRDIEEIAPVEIANAMAGVAQASGGLVEEQLYTETLDRFGFKRRTQRTAGPLERARELALRTGRLSSQGGYYVPGELW